jgi:hypothetical protein
MFNMAYGKMSQVKVEEDKSSADQVAVITVVSGNLRIA